MLVFSFMTNIAKYSLGLKAIAFLKAIRGFGALLFALSLSCSISNLWLGCQLNGNFFDDSDVIAPLLFSASEWLNSFDKTTVLGLILAAVAYSGIRFLEAVGIFFDKTWAEYLAVITGFGSLVVIGRQFISQYSGILGAMLVINALVLLYLVSVLTVKRRRN
ncbi:DUF2127 domain-containing protein [Polynucleobacter paneuropaeus]|nr:DUF2127 domain-containing protein [Polynucleobacter paneuropaeus]